MEIVKPIRCRVAACRRSLDDGNGWSFYLINDSETALELAMLDKVGYEWGDSGNSVVANVRVTDLVPGAQALIWHDDGSGAELRMDLSLLVQMRGREVRLQFEFPRLYQKSILPLVDALGEPGWQVAAEG